MWAYLLLRAACPNRNLRSAMPLLSAYYRVSKCRFQNGNCYYDYLVWSLVTLILFLWITNLKVYKRLQINFEFKLDGPISSFLNQNEIDI